MEWAPIISAAGGWQFRLWNTYVPEVVGRPPLAMVLSKDPLAPSTEDRALWRVCHVDGVGYMIENKLRLPDGSPHYLTYGVQKCYGSNANCHLGWTEDQRIWTFGDCGANWYSIRPKTFDENLNVKDGVVFDSAEVILWRWCGGQANEKWYSEAFLGIQACH